MFEIGDRVMVLGAEQDHPGTILDAAVARDGTQRYRVRWYHPSERGPQKGWFNEDQIKSPYKTN